ncbi:MAG: aminotransferase class I/II-fold pyridoxal phosphate-dependent enzyme, partial [Dermatophilaceae bacterium]
MTALALEHDAINLGQGFPDTDGPPPILEAARQAIADGRNQYPPGPGVPELLDAIAAHQRRFYGIEIDPRREVLVTVGATEAIAAAVLALVQPGDEVVTFEPYYDSYAATIALAGGVRRTSVLRFPDFAVDEASLRAAFSPQTRLVLLNTPHNPTGRVFSRAELELIAELAREHDAWVLTDEVYEHLVF